jgi:hypothetical protein
MLRNTIFLILVAVLAFAMGCEQPAPPTAPSASGDPGVGNGSPLRTCNYSISGTVFTDADSNGIASALETGISGVTVRLAFGDDSPMTLVAITDADGNYAFTNLCGGEYVVSVDRTTIPSLQEYLAATTPESRDIKLDAKNTSEEADFGYSVSRTEIIEALRDSTLPTTGLSPMFWRVQFGFASMGWRTTVPETTLTRLLLNVEAFSLATPFQFGNGSRRERFRNAGRILAYLFNCTDSERLQRVLLATELNFFYRRGIDPALQEVLQEYGEVLVNSLETAPGAKVRKAERPEGVDAEGDVEETIEIFRRISQISSGGGGGGQSGPLGDEPMPE